MKKMHLFLTAILISGIALSGCGADDKETKEDVKADAAEKKETKPADEKKEIAEEPKEETEKDEDTTDYAELNKQIEENTEGKAEVLYENEEPKEHKLGELTTTLESYELISLKDFHADFDIPFDGETDGGVLVAKYNIHNGSDKDLYYMPGFNLTYTGAERYRKHYRELLPEDEQLAMKLTPDNDYLVKAGETVTGYETYPLGQKALDEVLELSTVTIQVPVALSKKDDFGSAVGSEGNIQLRLDAKGEEKVEKDASFYKDKATTENMGDKEMLKEKSDIGKTEKLGESEVTLDGYQFTKFTPNKEEAPRFENFKNGIVLLTVKFNVENKGSEDIGTSSIGSVLNMNDGSQYTLNEGMLLNRKASDVIKPGDSEELLQVYTIDEEQYEKILKDKSFDLEFGPLLNKDARDISKGRKAKFDLPN